MTFFDHVARQLTRRYPDDLNFRAAYDSDSWLHDYLKPKKAEVLRNQVYGALAEGNNGKEYENAKTAAAQSGNIRRELLFVFEAYRLQFRKDNKKEDAHHHALRVFDKAAGVFGPDAMTVNMKALGHDLEEDGYIGDKLVTHQDVERLFGAEVADGITRLSLFLNDSPADDWLTRAERKKQAKFAQAAILTPDELVIKAIDNLDDIHSRINDLKSGRLTVRENGIKSRDAKSVMSLEELQTKMADRAEHHGDYMNRLKRIEPITYGDRTVDFRQMARDLNREAIDLRNELVELMDKAKPRADDLANPERRAVLANIAVFGGATLAAVPLLRSFALK